MDPFQLTEDAISDIDAIWLYFRERADLETADRVVTEIFKGFYRLAEMPARGHRRPDLTSRPVLFYRIFSYLIIYQFGTEPLQILGVLHDYGSTLRAYLIIASSRDYIECERQNRFAIRRTVEAAIASRV